MNPPPNYTRRMLWMFVGQVMFMAALFVWSDILPLWASRIIVATVILFPPTAYLTVLAQPSVRRAWVGLFRDFYLFALSIPPALKYWFSFRTVAILLRSVYTLRVLPDSLDGWIALGLLPFKTCIVATFPIIWIFEKIASHSSSFRPYGRTLGLSYESIFQIYLISLLALFLGALLQSIFCGAGRATTTLRFFLLGLILPLVLALMSRAI